MRRASRRDLNEADVVQALRRTGWLVHRLDACGVPDLLCCHAATRRIVLVEVKGARGKLTPDQREFVGRWPVVIVRSEQDALELGRFSSRVGAGGAGK